MIGLTRLDIAEYVGEWCKGPIQSLLGAHGNVDKKRGAVPEQKLPHIAKPTNTENHTNAAKLENI